MNSLFPFGLSLEGVLNLLIEREGIRMKLLAIRRIEIGDDRHLRPRIVVSLVSAEGLETIEHGEVLHGERSVPGQKCQGFRIPMMSVGGADLRLKQRRLIGIRQNNL